ncbi:unnamed protein product [Fraxinus pennsylvanica]|uniref:Protein kinase domain-containing protein n=1 Tax=Fraxinus pennsylvanica TaxID=56036 RepID=A0AAD2EE30_9LAMI|nr:unnamed protein product [Fraxinus pennsylvanica]
MKRISYYEVLNATNKFDGENLIDKGNIGSVYKGIFSDGMIAAIKVFKLDLEGANRSLDKECQILYNIRDRNLVKVITSCSNLDLKALVLEYMPNGNFTKWLSSSNYFLNIAPSALDYGVMLMETFTNKKPTDDKLVAEFTMRRWVFESFPVHIVDVDLVNAVEDDIRAEESFFKSVMGLAIECTVDLSEERLNMN